MTHVNERIYLYLFLNSTLRAQGRAVCFRKLVAGLSDGMNMFATPHTLGLSRTCKVIVNHVFLFVYMYLCIRLSSSCAKESVYIHICIYNVCVCVCTYLYIYMCIYI